ncbi:MAG: bifunctional phosphoglucose/phosphomannose isomerase [Candidatus Omnitrophica bacterium]|nr:bifunctional phosphoglucose/phosphomannose isomerase [Candidatus Omnitrophota bacterium]
MKRVIFQSICRIDKKNMLDYLLDFPLQCRMAKEYAAQIKINLYKKDFNKVVFLGMGGSAIGGEFIKSYLYNEIDVPILVLREYDLAQFIDKYSLVFVLSYSGDTEETLSAYDQAKRRDSTIIAISSGGRLKDICLNDGTTFIPIPSGFPPRAALGYLGILPLGILERLGMIKKREYEYEEMFSVLEELKKRSLHPMIAKSQNIAKYIAYKIYQKLPLIYTASLNFEVVAMRFRAQINENAKSLALSNLFPEMNHNEIQGFINLKNVFKHLVAIFLKDNQLHPRVKKRIEITEQILRDKGVPVFEIFSLGRYLLTRIFSLIYIGDFISFYLALLYKTDPTPVETISYLKERLKE